MPTDVAKFSKGYKGKATVAEKLAPGPKAVRAAKTTAPPSRSGGTSGDLTVPGYTPSTPTGAPYSPTEGPTSVQRQIRSEARQAKRTERRESRRRVRKVKSYVRQRDTELAPKREVKVSKAFLEKATSPKPVTVAGHSRKLPGSEAPRAKPVKVAEHQRAAPTFTKAEEEVLQQDAGGRKLQKQAEHAAGEPSVSSPRREAIAHETKTLEGLTTLGPKLVAKRAHEYVDGQEAEGKPKPEAKGTPQERKASRRQVVKARKAVVRSKPELLGDFGPAQKQFIEQTAKETGLNPKTIAVQSIAEEGHGPGSPAANYEAEGENNFLNLGPGQHFATPQEGAAATAANFNNTASSNYAGVRATKGQSVEAQLQAIEESPWDGGHYQGSMLQKILASGEVQVKPGDPQAVRHYKVAIKKAKSLGLKVGPPPPDITAEPAAKTIKVKATAAAAVKWAESNLGEPESSAKIEKLASNFGLNSVTEPWCANFVSNNLARRGFGSKLPANPNYTPSYEEWGAEGKYATDVGTDISAAKPGDVLTFSGDHTAMYVGGGEMISGNFSDEVERTPVSAGPAPLSMIIRPKYKGGWIKVKETTPLPGTTSSTGSLSESSAPAIVSAVSTPPTSTTEGKQQHKGKKPIELTPLQQINKKVRKLRSLGVEIAGPGQETKAEAANKPGDSSLHQQLAALESKYKIGAV